MSINESIESNNFNEFSESVMSDEVTFQYPPKLENVTEIPESSAYVAHLATIPALAAVNGMISSFPIPKIFASNGIPLMMYMNKRDKE